MSQKHLDSLYIHRFRGLRDLELSNLGQINLLVGINNCGKTSVLEAINIYSHPLDIREWASTATLREGSIPSSFGIYIDGFFTQDVLSLNEEDLTKKISISSTGQYFLNKLDITRELIEKSWGEDLEDSGFSTSDTTEFGNDSLVSENTEAVKRGIFLQASINHHYDGSGNPLFVNIENSESWEIWQDRNYLPKPSRLGKTIKLPTSIVTLTSHAKRQESLLSQAKISGLDKLALKLIQQIDEDILDIQILVGNSRSSSYYLSIKHRKFATLVPVTFFGDGVRRLFHIALKLADAKDGILLIDEIEATIHTEAIQDTFEWIAKWAKELNVQVFATTHSLEAVDAMIDAADSASDLVLYRLEPTEAKTRVVRHDWERLKRLRENLGQEVRW